MKSGSLRSYLRLATALLVMPVLVQACGSDDGDDDGDGGIALTLGSSSATVAQGGSTTSMATLTRTGTFTGAVTFSVTGAPTGVTAGIASVSTTGSTTSGTVTIVVAADAPAGTYNLTVRATGSGVDDATAPFTLTISATTTPNYSISLTPAALTVAQGATGNTSATLTRTGGFVGNVNLSLTNAPAGVTASFTPNNTTANTSAIVVTVGSAVPAGTYTVYVGGVATGQGDKITPLVLTVTATAAQAYTLSVAGTASVAQGNSITPAVTIARTGGFAGSVALTATGMPNGMNASFSPSSTTGNTSTLTLAAGASTVAGVYPIVIHGASTLAEQTATISVTVTTSGGGNGNASISFANCAVGAKPLFLAFQNGSGAWTAATPTSDVYSFTVNAGKGGYAYVTKGTGDEYTLAVQYMTQAEITAAQVNVCGATAGTKTYSGIASGLGATDVASLNIGGGSASPSSFAPAFTINNIAAGSQDLIGWRRSALNPFGANEKGFLRRDVNLTTGAALGTIDFNGAESFTPLTATYATTNGVSTTPVLFLATGASCSLGAVSTGSATLTGLPTALTRATDYYVLSSSDISGNFSRNVFESFHTFGNRSVTYGPNLSTVNVTSLGGAYKRLQAAFTIPAEYQTSMTFQYTATSPFRSVTVGSSYGWVGSSAATLPVPDLSGLAGWSNTWVPATSATVNWTVATLGSTNLTSAGFCADGAKTSTAAMSGTN